MKSYGALIQLLIRLKYAIDFHKLNGRSQLLDIKAFSFRKHKDIAVLNGRDWTEDVAISEPQLVDFTDL